MLKYPKVIEKLNLRQKLALLTDVKSLADAEILRAGVAEVNVATMKEINAAASRYPDSARLARSWDRALFCDVSEQLAAEAGARGVELVVAPDVKSGVSPYSDRLSEDPYLCGALGGSCLEGIRRANVGSCLSEYSLREEDAEYLDVRRSDEALKKFYEIPFRVAQEKGNADALRASLAPLSGDYSDVNRRMVREASKGESFLFCENVPLDADFNELLGGNVFLGGAVLPLDSALGRYRRLKERVEEGTATEEELAEEVRSGRALSEERLDEAVDRVIGLAQRLSSLKTLPPEHPESLCRRAAEESIVLMKNKEVLPLSPETKVAVVGALATEGEESFAVRFSRLAGPDHNLRFAGQAEGYSLTEERSEELIPEAVRVAEEADVVLLFLGLGARENEMSLIKSLALPACQLALIDALVRTGKKIVAVVGGDRPVEMGFDEKLHAVLLAPAEGGFAQDALMGVLAGKVNPSGKLTRTGYDNTDELFLVSKKYKDAGRNRMGGLVGYRRYDLSGTPPRYPFGHGLGYSPFAYSGLEIGERSVRFTVTNLGSFAGKEVVQVYAGKKGVRPLKELVAFEKVELAAGESKPVEIALPAERFCYYNEDSHTFSTDGGAYTLYIGASVTDIRLKGVFTVAGEPRAEKEEAISDYLLSETNVMHGGYTLKDARSRILRNRKEHKIMRIAALIMLAISAIADVFLIAAASAGVSFGGFGGLMFFVNFLLLLSCAALICERATRGKGAIASLPESAVRLDGAESAENAPLEQFFVKALEEKETEETLRGGGEEGEAYFDESLTFARACEELSAFTADSGLVMSADTVRSLFSALASTRCLILRGPVKPLVKLAGLLAEYFGSPFYMEGAERCRDLDDLLYKDGVHGVRVKSNIYRAIVSANELKPYLQFAVLNRVKLSALEGYFAPVAERLGDPRAKPLDLGSGEQCALAPNLRFLLILSEGQSPEELPACVADVASWLTPELTPAPPREGKRLTSPYGYRQLAESDRLAKMTCEIDEALWKRVDRLESAVNAREPYRIGNRLWLMTENYAAVYLACGGTQEEALDSVVAVKLLARMLAIWRRTGTDKLLPVLNEIFGEDLPRCARMLRNIREEGEE